MPHSFRLKFRQLFGLQLFITDVTLKGTFSRGISGVKNDCADSIMNSSPEFRLKLSALVPALTNCEGQIAKGK